MRTIGTDALANKANELKEYLERIGVEIQLLTRLKSIHGSDDDIIEIDIDKSAHLRLLGDDDNPGQYILINIQRLIDKQELPENIWEQLVGLTEIGITPKN